MLGVFVGGKGRELRRSVKVEVGVVFFGFLSGLFIGFFGKVFLKKRFCVKIVLYLFI